MYFSYTLYTIWSPHFMELKWPYLFELLLKFELDMKTVSVNIRVWNTPVYIFIYNVLHEDTPLFAVFKGVHKYVNIYTVIHIDE